MDVQFPLNSKALGRFERQHRNELWQADINQTKPHSACSKENIPLSRPLKMIRNHCAMLTRRLLWKVSL